ncbi:MAG TPA: histone deacetylase [Gemmataceae bacterium]|nr:histone deacetylase [Gemmataceae bacterium]
MTLLYSDPVFLEHQTGQHPETAERLRAIDRVLGETGRRDRCTAGTFTPLPVESLKVVHVPPVVERVRRLAEAGGGHLDADTVVSPASYRVGLAAAGACSAAVDAVLQGKDRTALCLVRPPGHHATPTHSMGFCLFNNIAIAARHAQKTHGVGRVMIIDWDVHHGNGTQDIFYDDPSVFFLSIHRYGHGFYPGTGAADETGQGSGLGTTRNVPIRYGTSRGDYRDLTARAVETVADTFKPELVLVSAGFDAHRLDPIGSLGLETEDFAELTKLALAVARTHAGGRLVSCLEGGYHWQATADSVATHLRTLLDAPTP